MDPVQAFEEGLAQVSAGYKDAFAGARDEQALRAANARFLGPEGELTKLMKLMPKLPGDRRKDLGQRANAQKGEISAAFDAALLALASAAREAELSAPPLDVTMPGRDVAPGKLHPITRVLDELLEIFVSLGFDVAEGPEIDLHENCFDRLGFPPDHPATDMQDTFFVARPEGATGSAPLLRTHTSTIQVREMMRRKPPLAVVGPGTVYRRDDDATHSPMFYQLEGFVVDTDVSFADLRGVLQLFVKRLFHAEAEVRFRPSYFPFVEPGGEVDISCSICRAWEKNEARTSACRICKGTGWLEVLGCGMIHPAVFEAVGYDPKQYRGFAFGLGLDRIAMMKYDIPHIRHLYENDVRFLSSF